MNQSTNAVPGESCCSLTQRDSDAGEYECLTCKRSSCGVHAAVWTNDERRCYFCFSPCRTIRPQLAPVLSGEPSSGLWSSSALLILDGLYIAGAQRHCLELLRVFSERRVHTTVLSLFGGGRWAAKFSENANRLCIAPGTPSLDWNELSLLLGSDAPDLVSVHLLEPIQWALQSLPKGLRAYAHFHCEPSEHEAVDPNTFCAAIQRFRRVFVPSLATKHHYDSFKNTMDSANEDGKRLRVFPNGFATEHERLPSRQPATGRLRVALVTRLDTDKLDVALLIATLQHLLANGPSFEFRVAGDGELRPGLEDTLVRCGMAEHVQLLGFVDDIWSTYGWADVVFLPSKREACPYAVLEAVMAGRPVVAPRLGFLAESNGTWGGIKTFHPGDAATAARLIPEAHASDKLPFPGWEHIGLLAPELWRTRVAQEYEIQ